MSAAWHDAAHGSAHEPPHHRKHEPVRATADPRPAAGAGTDSNTPLHQACRAAHRRSGIAASPC
ncbi:hypothetical protein D7S86_13390 [Pararobbsia silviterrae]|uniref:Uncharacterized protein n=1 Tax=Pararobbsia silviterrae TaxID=1792498 RepID=A0A494Y2S8_9BURK|nr:hypothetical protein D7S86_13390 [Pararobbsia silviterrae]